MCRAQPEQRFGETVCQKKHAVEFAQWTAGQRPRVKGSADVCFFTGAATVFGNRDRVPGSVLTEWRDLKLLGAVDRRSIQFGGRMAV